MATFLQTITHLFLQNKMQLFIVSVALFHSLTPSLMKDALEKSDTRLFTRLFSLKDLRGLSEPISVCLLILKGISAGLLLSRFRLTLFGHLSDSPKACQCFLEVTLLTVSQITLRCLVA